MRQDLPPGDALAQTIHAAGESAALLGRSLPEDTHAIALHARDECDLLRAAQALARLGIPSTLIREPDPPYLGQATALGAMPSDDYRALKRALGRYPLAHRDRRECGKGEGA